MKLNGEKIGAFISSCRREQNLTQGELGERLGVSPQSVSNWERGESLPDICILMDLSELLHCSVDALLSGGDRSTAYRRYITVAQMREALAAISRIGALLGHDHFVYRTMVEALDARMNSSIEEAFTNDALTEVYAAEFLIECVQKGDYADPRDVSTHIKPQKAREYVLKLLRDKGIR